MVENLDPSSDSSSHELGEHKPLSPANSKGTSGGDFAHGLWLGRSLIVIAALLWSTSGFFAKAPIFENWPLDSRGGLLVFWRATFASAVLLFFVRKVQWSWKLVPTALIFALMNWTYLSSLVYGEATLAIWMQYTAPMWVFLFGLTLLKERPVWQDWLLLAFAVLGLTVILSSQLQQSSAGLPYGIASGFTFAAVVLTLRWCREFDSAWIIFLNHAVTAIVFLPVINWLSREGSLKKDVLVHC